MNKSIIKTVLGIVLVIVSAVYQNLDKITTDNTGGVQKVQSVSKGATHD